jgi:hypothetical protein
MRTAVFLLLGATACGSSTPVTAKDTVLFEWELAKASRADVRSATIGAHTTKDFKVRIVKGEAPFTLLVHLETADIDYEEGGRKVSQRAPIALRAVVAFNDAWDLGGSCEDGPNYQMPSAGPDGGLVTPRGMLQGCRVKYHRRAGTIFTSEWSLGTTLEAHGDGTLSAFPAEDAVIE